MTYRVLADSVATSATDSMISMLSYVMPWMAGVVALYAAGAVCLKILRGVATPAAVIGTVVPASVLTFGIMLFPEFLKSVLGTGTTDRDGNPLLPFTFGDTSETTATSATATTSVPAPTATATPTTSALPTAHTTAPSIPTEPSAPVIEWSTVGPLLAAAAGLAAIGLLAYFGGGALRHRREERRAELKAARLEAQKAAAAAAEAAKTRQMAWEKACAVLSGVIEDYTEFENDLKAVILERAFLADITTPATAAFHLDYEGARLANRHSARGPGSGRRIRGCGHSSAALVRCCQQIRSSQVRGRGVPGRLPAPARTG